MTPAILLPPLPKPSPARLLWLPDFDVPPQAPDPERPKFDDVR